MKYKNLFSPLKLNSIILRNRIISAPMALTNGDYIISGTYYGGLGLHDISLGGCGLIVIPEVNDDPKNGVLSKYNKEITREQINLIRQAGAKACCEVTFHGFPGIDGTIPGPVDGVRNDGFKMKKMTKQDMSAFIERIARHCRNLKEFGFDALFLAFGHDSLCSYFLSPHFNSRDDEYGGSLQNRCRFPLEAIKTIRQAVGDDWPIIMRLSRELKVPESYKPEDMLYFIRQIQDYVDMVNISTGMDSYGGVYENYIGNIHAHTTFFFPHMYSLEFAKKVKKQCKVLVSIVGGVVDPKEADEAIAKGYIDTVMMGRQLIADPFWPRKAMNGNDEDIVPCIRCSNCFPFVTAHDNVVCSVNPRFRRENRVPLELEKTNRPKKVVIVGGGPAGMVAAITAHKKGHQVILIEKSSRLGGLLNCADYSSLKQDLARYRNYLITQINKIDIDIRLNTTVTRKYIEKLNPDSLIIAVGSSASIPKIKGLNSSDKVYTVTEFYEKNIHPDGDVLIIGGGSVGSELALELSDKARNVHVVEYSDALASNSNIAYRLSLRYFLPEHKNINVHLNSKVIQIDNDKAIIEQKGNTEEIKADTIIIATGFKSNRKTVEQLFGIIPDTYEVGDCEKVRSVCEASNDAYFIAANL